VTGEGVLAGVLMRPVEPVLVGFPRRAIELRKGLAIAGRVADASGMRVEEVRIITPADYQLRLRRPADQRSVVVHVAPEVTFGESYWCDRVSAGDQPPPWADLRWDDRVVVGGLG
jgi:hypothetical protein